MPRDLRNNPSAASTRKRPLVFLILILAVSAAATWVSFRCDEPVRQAVILSHGKDWNKTDDYKFHSSVRRHGDWPWLMLAGGISLVIAWKMRSREWMRILVAAMIASTLAGLLVNTSRLTTGRIRPRETPKIAEGFYGPWHDGHLTIGNPKYNAFPSGHTATAFGFAGVIFFAVPWIGLGALLLAALIAVSSIVIGAHHPSDVVVSIIVSLAVAWFVWQWIHRHGDHYARILRQKLRNRK
jgi:membrane-associated phospholipid phosphatase